MQIKARLISKRIIADNTLEFAIEPEVWHSFQPGQYVIITIPSSPYTDEKGNRRSFTIASPPSEKGRYVFMTRLSSSAFKRSLSEMTPGSILEVTQPVGKLAMPRPSDGSPVVFIAGGIGITPFYSMLKEIEAKNESGHDITLIYSNKTRSSAAHSYELERLKIPGTNYKAILTFTQENPTNQDESGAKVNRGRVCSELISTNVSDVRKAYYIVVGPPGLIESTIETLKSMGVSKEKILTENFGGYENHH